MWSICKRMERPNGWCLVRERNVLCNDCMRTHRVPFHSPFFHHIARRNYFRVGWCYSTNNNNSIRQQQRLPFGASCLLAYTMNVFVSSRRLHSTIHQATPKPTCCFVQRQLSVFQLAFNHATRMSSIPIEEQFRARSLFSLQCRFYIVHTSYWITIITTTLTHTPKIHDNFSRRKAILHTHIRLLFLLCRSSKSICVYLCVWQIRKIVCVWIRVPVLQLN